MVGFTRGLLIAVSCLLFGGAAFADSDNSVTVGDHVIHYNAFISNFLEPEVASAVGVRRSKQRGVLNVVVNKAMPEGNPESVAARVSASAVNLNGQARTLDMREVRSGGGIYYLSDFRISDKETLSFKVDVTPPGERRATTIRFTKQFFTE